MKEIIVSLDIITPKNILKDEILDFTDFEESRCEKRDFKTKTIWHIESKEKKDAPLIEHVNNIFTKKVVNSLSNVYFDKFVKVLTLGVITDLASCSVQVSTELLDLLNKTRVSLEITYYSADEE